MVGGVQIIRIGAALPPGMDGLLEAATAESVRNVGLLVDSWNSGTERFDKDGAALFGAMAPDRVVGIGGVTPQAGLDEPAMRMRRFYILPEWRRKGLGRRLAEAAMNHGLTRTRLLTCNARATSLAPPFWEAMGFFPSDLAGLTHIHWTPGSR